MKIRDYILTYINGERKEFRGNEIFENLSSILRYGCGLTGTKVVCAEGDCGACTVMTSRVTHQPEAFQSMNSCIAPIFLMDGAHIISVEGVKKSDSLSEIQKSMCRNFGGQCGFCTPGFVMSIVNLYEHNQGADEKKVKNYLTGNLCRCTGYTPIIESALDVDLKKHERLQPRYPNEKFKIEMEALNDTSILITTKDREFFAPRTLAAACEYKTKHPDVRIFSSATDLGVQNNKGRLQYQHAMSLHLIPELYDCDLQDGLYRIGARANLSQIQKLFEKSLRPFADFLNIFASPQIKNVATLIGNLANASPIADTVPPLIALDADVLLYGPAGQRRVTVEKFILGYKKLDLRLGEIITHIEFRAPDLTNKKVAFYKISQRRDLDISALNAAFTIAHDNLKILQARIVYGGVGPTVQRLHAIESALVGRPIDANLILEISKKIKNLVMPLSDVRGTAEFRRELCGQLFEKFMKQNFTSTTNSPSSLNPEAHSPP